MTNSSVNIEYEETDSSIPEDTFSRGWLANANIVSVDSTVLSEVHC